MTTPTCIRCTKPMPDAAYACTSCVNRARRQLATIAELAPAARDVVHRLVRRGGGPVSGKPGSRPPLDLEAGERLDAVRNTLGGWVRHVVEERGIHPPNLPHGFDVLAPSARFLAEHLEWARHRQEIEEMLTDIDACSRRVYGMASGPEPGRYAGPCSTVGEDGEECGQDVTARPGAAYGTCPVCKAEYEVAEQQEWMIEQVRGYLARPIEIAGMLLTLGVKVGYSTIAAYAAKGRIVERGRDEQDRPLFRIGDVIDLRMGAK